MTTVEKAMEDVSKVLKKHDIGTYMIVLKCPDSDAEATAFDGASSWICGHAEMLSDLMKRRYNSDRGERPS